MSDLPALRAHARATLGKGSKSFAAAARLLPRPAREDAVLLYAWCRHCDDMIDGQDLGGDMAHIARREQVRRLRQLSEQTRAALVGDAPLPRPFEALRHVARRHGFPRRWPLDLLTGFAMDVEGRTYRSLDDTLFYAYHVAGVVGLMMARIMGVRDEAVLDRACDLGIAFQLTNIARDVVEDARAGRVYLPSEWLDEEAATVDPAAPIPSPHLHRCILRLLDTAELYYESAFHGLAALPFRPAWTVAASRRIYREIGWKVRRQGPDGQTLRINTSPARKLLLIALALEDARRRQSGRAAPGGSRAGLWTRATHLAQDEASVPVR